MLLLFSLSHYYLYVHKQKYVYIWKNIYIYICIFHFGKGINCLFFISDMSPHHAMQIAEHLYTQVQYESLKRRY